MTARVRPAGRSPARAAHGSREPLGRKGVHDAIYVNELDSACKKKLTFREGCRGGCRNRGRGKQEFDFFIALSKEKKLQNRSKWMDIDENLVLGRAKFPNQSDRREVRCCLPC